MQEQKQAQSCSTIAVPEPGLEQKKETETSIQSSITEESKVEENKSMRSTFETMELMNNGFCVDEVPLIEPHEMLVSCAASSSSTTYSSPSSSSHGSNNNFLEDLQFSDFEWPDNDIDLWGDDLSSCWDLLMNDADSDRKQAAAIDHHPPPINQCPRMVLDQESWTYGIL